MLTPPSELKALDIAIGIRLLDALRLSGKDFRYNYRLDGAYTNKFMSHGVRFALQVSFMFILMFLRSCEAHSYS